LKRHRNVPITAAASARPVDVAAALMVHEGNGAGCRREPAITVRALSRIFKTQ
jgi:hypothetical protein